MDPVTSSLLLLNSITQISLEVQSNRNVTRSLSQQCQSLYPALQTLQASSQQQQQQQQRQQQSIPTLPLVSADNLQIMVELLKEIEECLQKFLTPNKETKIEKMARLARLVDDHRSDMKLIQDFTERITQMRNDFAFGVVVRLNEIQDCKDSQDDLQSLLHDLASLHQETSAEGQDQIQQLQTISPQQSSLEPFVTQVCLWYPYHLFRSNC
jgi:hypothetical protein